MSVPAVRTTARPPRRAHSLRRGDDFRGSDLTAALRVAVLLAHVLVAQLTLLLAAAFWLTGRVSRWRPHWLAGPAGAGLVWTLAIGPGRAAAGLLAGPRQVLGYLAGVGGHPGHLLRPQGAFAGVGTWLPKQFPLALMLAAAEGLGLWWLQQRRGASPGYRPGLVLAARRRWTSASVRAGGMVTRNGSCLGVDCSTGRAAVISWPEAEGGVLCTGPSGPDLTETGFALAHAAIRRRKPVIAVDLTGSAWLASSIASACAAAGAPLREFGEPGQGYYEPVRGAEPAVAAGLVMAMIDWSGGSDAQRRSCAAYLTDALAVIAAAPARRQPVLDDLLDLLQPARLRDRARCIPAHHPRAAALANRVGVSAGLLQADPAMVAVPAVQLRALRACAAGQWLQPAPPGGVRMSLAATVAARAVAVFGLDAGAHGGPEAATIAALACADLTALGSELRGMAVPADGLAWINGCEAVEQPILAELIAAGQGAGMAVLLSTTSAQAADRLACLANVVVARGPVSAALAARFAGPAGSDPAEHAAAEHAAAEHLAADAAGSQAADALRLLVAASPRPRVQPWCRFLPSPVAGRSA